MTRAVGKKIPVFDNDFYLYQDIDRSNMSTINKRVCSERIINMILYLPYNSDLAPYSCVVIAINCDINYEKGPYCGTNIIGPDQTPRIMRGV